ncbi:MAG: hypothetical protein JXM70_10795 [Pirellulales bacterium]|nr:hypothetical protein [Pirellulales bacterium]
MTKTIRYIWALPWTIFGLLLAWPAIIGGRVRLKDGVIEAHGSMLKWFLTRSTPGIGGAIGITFGHVIIAQDENSLEISRSHELVHVRQYERWGPFFVPAYLASSLVVYLKGGRPYEDNYFEREARRLSG